MSDPLTSSQNPFRLERHGPLAELVLSRPARHNAFDADLMLGLLDCLDDLAHLHGHDLAERPHALLLRAEGKHFCAGADLNWMRNLAHADFEHNREDARVLARLMQTLDELPFPTVALIQGAAYGGALGLICACDLVLASDDARFCLSEVSLGLVPAVISPYVVRAMGMRQARRYMLTAGSIRCHHRLSAQCGTPTLQTGSTAGGGTGAGPSSVPQRAGSDERDQTAAGGDRSPSFPPARRENRRDHRPGSGGARSPRGDAGLLRQTSSRLASPFQG